MGGSGVLPLRYQKIICGRPDPAREVREGEACPSSSLPIKIGNGGVKVDVFNPPLTNHHNSMRTQNMGCQEIIHTKYPKN